MNNERLAGTSPDMSGAAIIKASFEAARQKPISLVEPLISEVAMQHTLAAEAAVTNPTEWIAQRVWVAEQRIASQQGNIKPW